MKEAAGAASLGVRLPVGLLGTLTNIHRAAMVCMLAGADCITLRHVEAGTGEYVARGSDSAVFEVGLVVLRAILTYSELSGVRVRGRSRHLSCEEVEECARACQVDAMLHTRTPVRAPCTHAAPSYARSLARAGRVLQVAFKPPEVDDANSAVTWMALVKDVMGELWTRPGLLHLSGQPLEDMINHLRSDSTA